MNCIKKKCCICFENKYPKKVCNTDNCSAIICNNCNNLLTDIKCPLCRQENVLYDYNFNNDKKYSKIFKYLYIFVFIFFSIFIFGILLLYCTNFHTFGLPVNDTTYILLLLFYGSISLLFLFIIIQITICILSLFSNKKDIIHPEQNNKEIESNNVEVIILNDTSILI